MKRLKASRITKSTRKHKKTMFLKQKKEKNEFFFFLSFLT